MRRYDFDRATLWHADCREAMAALPDNSVDAIVTDPPYGLEFMGKEWDSFRNTAPNLSGSSKKGGGWDPRDPKDLPESMAVYVRSAKNLGGYVAGVPFYEWCLTWAQEALRVLKPGGHIFAFGGTRTHHRLMAALEDAGFEIRDCFMWLYGSGFPKSMDVAKAFDRADGVWRGRAGAVLSENKAMSAPNYERTEKGEAVTDAAREWDGWGTAVKPAVEPIVLARKPLSEKSVIANIQKWGTGAINIDGCRIGTANTVSWHNAGTGNPEHWRTGKEAGFRGSTAGRFPANVLLTHSPDCRLVGEKKIKTTKTRERSPDPPAKATFSLGRKGGVQVGYGDEDGFETVEDWECAPDCPRRLLDEQSGERSGNGVRRKARSGVQPFRVDRGWNQHSMTRDGATAPENYGDSGGASRFFYCAKASQKERRGSKHPTVKPLALMRYLCRLITPPGGTVLDPFAGTGTTLEAAREEGFVAFGVEKDDGYLADALARLGPALTPSVPALPARRVISREDWGDDPDDYRASSFFDDEP